MLRFSARQSLMSHDPSRFTAAAVRQGFLDFFAAEGHRIVPSGPVFPQDDPTLLFTNAGMNQFKDVFLGTGTRDYARAADTQKCIRVQGKHNDLEEVGVDTYHHTFFEMLGNWSFGDYFKEEAIVWAWRLLTDVWCLEKERLWVTVFSGDAADGLPADEDAERIWLEQTDIDRTHVLRFDRADNFWEMGETGPCGPCSEIHIDRGGPGSNPADGADPALGVNAGNERFIELWNLVFMQFNRQDDGELAPLPAPCVDTGMGFERILSVLQGKRSNYDTDLFRPIFDALEQLTGKTYGAGDAEVDVAFRVCADHVRAVSSALGDGALPSNEGRGYVLRRLIRRASRYGLQALEMREPFLFALVPAVAEVLGGAFPEIAQRVEHLQLVVKSEEESFRRTLERGLVQFERLAGGLASGAILDGRAAYELYATYGFPEDLVELMCRERGLVLDGAGWEAAREAHSNVSRSEGSFQQLLSAEQLTGLPATRSTYHEAGDVRTRGRATVLRVFQDPGRPDRAVLDSSPFYGESGGQVGDTGTLETEDGAGRFVVEDTQRMGDVVVHVGRAEGSFAAGAVVRCSVDAARRAAVMANHSATHLLHKALREVLGEHVTQQGSYVGPDRLRFDLSHPKGLTEDELREVETRVNDTILRNGAVTTTVEGFDDAKARGVMALFGEKYGDTVRVVDVGAWSTELCGGTHVSAAGEIGPFVIVSERAIQAGVRRIEALTHATAVAHMQEQKRLLQSLCAALRVKPEELPERVAALQGQVKDAKKAQKAAAAGDLGAAFDKLKAGLAERGGVLAGAVDLPELDAGGLRDLSGRVKTLGADLAVVMLGRDGGKVPVLALCLGAAQERGLRAGTLVKELAGLLGGGGGGKPDAAQGQGSKADQVSVALDTANAKLAAALG
jgi:alanyl-tRNA synthetase